MRHHEAPRPSTPANSARRRRDCRVDGHEVQKSRTSQMVFAVPELIARLSAVLPLLPGDLIFTGTPAGIGAIRQPPEFLRPGQVLSSYLEGVGTMANRMIAPPA
jgi:2,4-didehydro-3-deoxy-L-rhamnonate hydrolase